MNKILEIFTDKKVGNKVVKGIVIFYIILLALCGIWGLFDWLVNKKMWQVVISVPLAFLINWVGELWDWLGHSYNRIWILGAIFALYILNKLEKLHKRFEDIEKHLQEVKWFLEKKDRQQGNR